MERKERFYYNDYGNYMRRHFDFKVQKISIDGGFTCPNRDGTKGTGGCTYCNNRTFNPAYCHRNRSVTEQMNEGIAFFSHKYPQMRYLAYFQAYTNTYDSLDVLRARYEEALAVDGCVGIVIGTRPDCMPDELLDYLSRLSRRVYVMVEYGVESTDDTTLLRINRGHDYATAVDAVERTAAHGLPVGVHIILGLPGEERASFVAQARMLSQLPITTLKLHQLQLIRGTRMAEEYAENPSDFHLFRLEEYIEVAVDYLENLRPDIVVERFASQSPKELLIAPDWGLKNHELVDKIKRRMRERDTWQGKFYADAK
ncbi:MAG: TIGR01212 family radical SAM protein [Bacteroidaceae bacterium]|nr:TIGR01212 family radical SAM protein [Bacteroidaceae bacterium]